MYLRCFKTVLLSLSLLAKADSVTVNGSSGVSYLGVRNTTTNQDAFLGIPYAKPPVGSLRFKPPQAWYSTDNTTLVNATADKPICVQSTPIVYSLVSEDCLHLSLCEL
jgi:carboxylesterase type B